MLSLVSASTTFAPVPVARSPPARMQSAGSVRGSDYAKTLPAAGPFGFFDPLGEHSTHAPHTAHRTPRTTPCTMHLTPGLTSDLEPGTVRYFREVEVKHGRVAMLGALGFLVGESFHPLFGGDIDVPAFSSPTSRRRSRLSGRRSSSRSASSSSSRSRPSRASGSRRSSPLARSASQATLCSTRSA